MARKITKKRNWAFVVYPQSAPSNWEDMLSALRVPAFVSPLHDSDLDTHGNVKKPHYHVLITFDGPVTRTFVKKTIEPFCGTKSPEAVRSIRSYVRYLIHLDDKDKAQYDAHDIKTFSGADAQRYIIENKNKTCDVLDDIMGYCEKNHVYELCDLLAFARREHKSDWLPAIIRSSYLIDHYLSSMRYKATSTTEPLLPRE